MPCIIAQKSHRNYARRLAPDNLRIYKKSLDPQSFCIYKNRMKTDWDPAKNERNVAKHGLDFADFDGFDSDPLIIEDNRSDYGEVRCRAFGFISGRAYSLAFTMRGGVMRLISWRPAHKKEMRRHGL